MKTLLSSALFLLSMSVFSHCPIDFGKVSLCADLEWIDGPYLGKKSHFKLTFWKKGDESRTPVPLELDIDIYSWMIMEKGHSHGGPKMNFQEVDLGIFEVKDARFFMHGMHGYWQVRVDLLNEGRVIARGSSKVNFANNGGKHDH